MITTIAIKTYYFGFVEMFLKNSKRSIEVFSPATWLPPNAITPENDIYSTIAQRLGGQGGQARSPPSYSVL